MCAICSVAFLSIGYTCGWFSHKHKHNQSSTSKAASEKNICHNEGSDQLPQAPRILYEELQQNSAVEYEDLVELKENVTYGPIAK